MTKIEKKLATAIATGALLLNTALPAFAGITIELSGNGSDSQNEAEVEVNQVTSVTQTNTANISNNVKAEAETGENDASRNTGGSVTIDTGDAKTEVKVTNQVNSNVADVQCCDASIDVLIEGNGDNSKNVVDIDYPDDDAQFPNGTFVTQTNTAKIYNNVEAESSTGDNDAKRNTGGDVSITTGNATTKVDLLTMANSNWAQVSSNGNGGPSITARILGNGADSDNEIELEYDAATVVDQYNYAKVKNDVEAEAETGENDASRNTGGTVSIDTGDASTTVEVDNMINFNWADVDCGCLLDVLAKIAGNGDHSDNDINAELAGGVFVDQENTCKKPWGDAGGFGEGWRRWHKPCLDNDVEAESETGDNDAKRNTGDPGVDPSIETGNADTEVVIENSGNSNVYGAGAPDFEFPEWLGGGFSINISLDLSALLALLGLA